MNTKPMVQPYLSALCHCQYLFSLRASSCGWHRCSWHLVLSPSPNKKQNQQSENQCAFHAQSQIKMVCFCWCLFVYIDFEFVGHSLQLLLQSSDLLLGTDGLLPLCSQLPLVAAVAQLHAALQLLHTRTHTNKS